MSAEASPDSLRLALQVPDTVRAGEAVPITLRLTNAGDEPLELELRGRPIAFDVVVEDARGDVVWRRLEGEMVPAILQVRTLPPGDGLELTAEWDQRDREGEPVPPGVYTLRGTLPEARTGPLETPPATLRVLPPGG